MTDHKFEPFEQVLVRDFDTQNWKADLFSHIYSEDGDTLFACMGDAAWLQCIPYTPETAHLLGTSQPYEPPKPPQEYEWGQKVEVLQRGEWDKGLYIGCVPISQLHRVYTDKHGDGLFAYTEIRPLPDDTAAN
jgi:hypothetical protein